MTENASFFFAHAFEIRLAVALAAIAAGILLARLVSSTIDVLTRIAGSAANVRDGLTTVHPSALGTR